MIHLMKAVGFLFAALLLGYIGFNTYQYFFDTTHPQVKIVGLDNNAYYAGDIVAHLVGDDNYKIDHFSVWLDNKPIVTEFSIKDRHFNYPLSIPVQNLQDGQHTIKVDVIDSTYHHNSTQLQRTFNTDNVALQAVLVRSESEYKVFQGRSLHVQFQVNKSVAKAVIKTLSQEFICYPEEPNSLIYEGFIPVDCDTTPNEYLFSIEVVDRVGNSVVLENKFQVIAFPFKKQIVTVENSKVQEESDATPLTESDFEAKMIELSQNSVQQKLWRGPFYVPLNMSGMSTEFGLIRTTQHKGRYAHKAVDLVAPAPRSLVWAAQDGIVVLKERYQHTGYVIVLDHGYGILTLYFHLEDFTPNIKIGDVIKKGKPLGLMGKTGYAKGYHLHWELRVNNIAVDPMQWTKKDFF